jgi:hypothetical protein
MSSKFWQCINRDDEHQLAAEAVAIFGIYMNIRINKMLLETSAASDVCRFYQGGRPKKEVHKELFTGIFAWY